MVSTSASGRSPLVLGLGVGYRILGEVRVVG